MPRFNNQYEQPIFIQKNGQQFGPFAKQQVIEYLQNGQFTSYDLGWQQGMLNPQPLGNLLQNNSPVMMPQIPTASNKSKDVLITEFGFHPKVAAFTVLIDLVVFSGTVLTVGFGWFFFVILAVALGYIAYNGQKNWYGDNDADAKTKAVMVAVLTGIPLPIGTALMAYKGITGKIKGHK